MTLESLKTNSQTLIFFVGLLFWVFSFYVQGNENAKAVASLRADVTAIDGKVDSIMLKQEKFETTLEFIKK